MPLVQGSGPGSPAAAVAAAAAAAAAAALRPLAAREQAIPRQVPATLRRDVLAASLRHPLAAVDRLLTNATYMNRLHVNQNMAHDLLPDVEEIVLPKVLVVVRCLLGGVGSFGWQWRVCAVQSVSQSV